MKIVEKKITSPEEVSGLASLLTTAFLDDPLFRWMFFDEKRADRYQSDIFNFMEISVRYYAKAGDILCAYDGDELVGTCLSTPPSGKVITAKSVATNGLLWAYARYLLSAPLPVIRRIFAVSDRFEAFHYNGAHYYVYELCSVRKGAGTALMQYAAEKYKGYPCYLETSNVDNLHFYAKCGLEQLPEMDIEGLTMMPMISADR